MMNTALLIVIAVHIIARLKIFAFSGIATPATRNGRNGAKKRLRISLSSSHVQLLVKHQIAARRKTVVGIPGTTTPTAASPTHATPIEARAHRRTEGPRAIAA